MMNVTPIRIFHNGDKTFLFPTERDLPFLFWWESDITSSKIVEYICLVNRDLNCLLNLDESNKSPDGTLHYNQNFYWQTLNFFRKPDYHNLDIIERESYARDFVRDELNKLVPHILDLLSYNVVDCKSRADHNKALNEIRYICGMKKIPIPTEIDKKIV